ncbi:MAG TPA: RelA/SpoT AH/RIS domain-containing protein, partial [Alphaproteobacteria bacterium]|nr:RelA/SpoT AH/RIS domain-containing protein [Alphaproteobacteria bacterium]
LTNGDQVEILRAKEPLPNPAWEGFVVTGRARSAIRRFVRNKQREEYRRLGQGLAERAFREAGHEFDETAIEKSLRVLNQKSVEDVYIALGEGHLASADLLARLFPGERRWRPIDAISRMLPARLRRGQVGARGGEGGMPIRGLTPGVAVHHAECCHPIPGDRIVGIMSKGKGVTIHTIDCEQLEKFQNHPESWIDVRWDIDPADPGVHVGRIVAVVSNEPGSLSSLSSIIARNMGNISNLKFTNRSADFFDMQVDIEVTDVKHLTNIIAALRVAPCISKVERVRG